MHNLTKWSVFRQKPRKIGFIRFIGITTKNRIYRNISIGSNLLLFPDRNSFLWILVFRISKNKLDSSKVETLVIFEWALHTFVRVKTGQKISKRKNFNSRHCKKYIYLFFEWIFLFWFGSSKQFSIINI
jgi:hypothetical protein